MIRSLGYIGFISPAAAEWRAFGPEVLGAELAGDGPDGAVRLRLDHAVHRLTIHPGDTDALAYLGWDVGDQAGLDAVVASLLAAGVDVGHGDEAFAARRAVEGVAWCVDPFGFRHELSHGLQHGPAFTPGRSISGFVTGAGGLGHAVLIVPDLDRAVGFYEGVLGLELSDAIESGLRVRFLHCNPRHHTLAFAHLPGLVGLHHLMLEVGTLDDVGSGLDIVNERGIPLAMALGRHTNDLMTSFYVRTPSGFEIEYGTGGALVDAGSWETRTFLSQSLWGHHPPATGPLFPGILRSFEPPMPTNPDEGAS